jgi:3-oxoacyl-[acyl-carrier-protein] synthase-3
MVTLGVQRVSLLSPPTLAVGGRLRGLGAAQPDSVLSGAALGARVGRSAEWIETRTGIRELRVLAAGESLLELATQAAADAVRDAGPSSERIDLVIAATCSNRDGQVPLAPELSRVFAADAATLDLNAACSGFCYSVAVADALIRSGSAQRVLVVAAEHMTGLVDPSDLGTSIIFGDGAGAAVLDAAGDGEVHIGPVAWGSDGSQAELIAIPEHCQSLTMAGQQVFRWAVDEVRHVAAQACANAGVTLAEIDAFVPHQANARIVDALTTQLGLEHATIARDVTISGNTSAASIPIALTKLLRDGSAKPGQLALLVGFGAGLTYAAQVVRLP